MNTTAEKFGFPDTLVKEYEHWLVLVRPQQVTLGSLVLVCKEPVSRFSDASGAAFTELHDVVGGVEGSLSRLYDYQKINYMMLMMVDPDVHYHVIPRYDAPRSFAGRQLIDHGWPALPALGEFVELDADTRAQLVAELQSAWV